jgi:hypothetical protein
MYKVECRQIVRSLILERHFEMPFPPQIGMVIEIAHGVTAKLEDVAYSLESGKFIVYAAGSSYTPGRGGLIDEDSDFSACYPYIQKGWKFHCPDHADRYEKWIFGTTLWKEEEEK